jgi:CheY-like chemotaxis protein
METLRDSVLVVEDDADQREAVSMALAVQGYRPVAVTNGREALDVLEREQAPTMILLDLAMPAMSGWTFLEEKRRRPGLATIPTLVMTAYDADFTQKQGLRDVEVLHKPFDIDVLLEAVHRHQPPGG